MSEYTVVSLAVIDYLSRLAHRAGVCIRPRGSPCQHDRCQYNGCTKFRCTKECKHQRLPTTFSEFYNSSIDTRMWSTSYFRLPRTCYCAPLNFSRADFRSAEPEMLIGGLP